jgi:hypothetical protein
MYMYSFYVCAYVCMYMYSTNYIVFVCIVNSFIFERESERREVERIYVVNQVRGDGEILSQVVSSQVSSISSICTNYMSCSFSISVALAKVLRNHPNCVKKGRIDDPIWRRVSQNGSTRTF